jgi:hypothetical protein
MTGRGNISTVIPSIFCSTVEEKEEFEHISSELIKLKESYNLLQRRINKLEARRRHIRNKWYYRRGKNGGS